VAESKLKMVVELLEREEEDEEEELGSMNAQTV
jgi:hypothetical protein